MKDIVLSFVHASWCGNCRAFEPVVKEVVAETGITLTDIDADKDMDFCEKEGIMNLPVIIIQKGDKKERVNGIVSKEKLLDLLKSFC